MRELKLKLYDEFQCVGSACPWNCCTGWKITIDEESLERYKSVTGPFGQEMMKSVVHDENNCAYAKVDENGVCSLLNKEKLCRIYIEAGEDKMSNTCKIYPRGEYIFGDIYLKYICISCPEMARMLFSQEMPLEFEISQNEKHSVSTDDSFQWDTFELLTSAMICTMDIMQIRDISVSTRLRLILLFNDELQKALNNGNNAREIIEVFSNVEMIEEIIGKIDRLPKKNEFYMNFILEVNRQITKVDESKLVYIIDYIKTAFGEFQTCADNEKVSFAQFIDSTEHKIIFENFCVYYIMRHYLESYNELNPCDIVVKMIQLCAVYAWLFGIYRPNVRNMENYTVIVAMVSRKMEHSLEHNSIYDYMCRGLCEVGMGEIDFLLKMLA